MTDQKTTFHITKRNKWLRILYGIVWIPFLIYLMSYGFRRGLIIQGIIFLIFLLVTILHFVKMFSFEIKIDEYSIEQKYVKRRKIPLLQIRDIWDNGSFYYIHSDNEKIKLFSGFYNREKIIEALLTHLDRLNHKPKLTFTKEFRKKLKKINSEIISKYIK